jgi:CheY-like chemotaxis protein
MISFDPDDYPTGVDELRTDKPRNLNVGPLGLRVLVVENDYLVAMLFTETLDELGCEIVGPSPTVSRALALIEAGEFDVALVDFHLQDEKATDVAKRLLELQRPFAIASGGGGEIEGHGQLANLHKPFMLRDVENVLRVLGSHLKN